MLTESFPDSAYVNFLKFVYLALFFLKIYLDDDRKIPTY